MRDAAERLAWAASAERKMAEDDNLPAIVTAVCGEGSIDDRWDEVRTIMGWRALLFSGGNAKKHKTHAYKTNTP